RPPRGHALGLMMALLVALAVTGGLVGNRLLASREQRPDQQTRVELLWLTRSAALKAAPGVRRLALPSGRTTVKVSRAGAATLATAERRGHTAQVRLERDARGHPLRWEEQYQRAPPPAEGEW